MSPTSLGQCPGPRGRLSFLPLVFLFSWFLSSSCAHAQLVNGQFFTNGMAISDSPAPHSQLNAGSNINIAIDLSGDGKLSQDAFLPTSSLSTAYQSLNIYLVSADTNLNFTVSEGPKLLQQEPGSTVKHLNWPIPSCAPSGNYNLTLYELSRINQGSYYSITPITVVIKSQSSSPCSGVPSAAPQPQLSSPPPQQPWLTPGYSISSASPATPGSNPTQSGAAPSTLSVAPSGTFTITLSPSPTTVTFVSTMTVPTTLGGIATVFTTETTVASVTTVLPSSGGGTFLPVNAALRRASGKLSGLGILGACIVAICHM